MPVANPRMFLEVNKRARASARKYGGKTGGLLFDILVGSGEEQLSPDMFVSPLVARSRAVVGKTMAGRYKQQLMKLRKWGLDYVKEGVQEKVGRSDDLAKDALSAIARSNLVQATVDKFRRAEHGKPFKSVMYRGMPQAGPMKSPPGKGMYLTPDPVSAASFQMRPEAALRTYMGHGGWADDIDNLKYIRAVDVNLKNPAVFNNRNEAIDMLGIGDKLKGMGKGKTVFGRAAPFLRNEKVDRVLHRELSKRGYDGVIYKAEDMTEALVFEPRKPRLP